MRRLRPSMLLKQSKLTVPIRSATISDYACVFRVLDRARFHLVCWRVRTFSCVGKVRLTGDWQQLWKGPNLSVWILRNFDRVTSHAWPQWRNKAEAEIQVQCWGTILYVSMSSQKRWQRLSVCWPSYHSLSSNDTRRKPFSILVTNRLNSSK